MAHDPDQPGYEADFDPYTPPPGFEPDAEEASDSEIRDLLQRIDHKLGVRSYAGGLAIVIALAGAIIAIVLALGARDEGATKNQLQSLKTDLAQASKEATKNAEHKVARLGDTVDEMSGAIEELRGTGAANATDIDGIQADLDDIKGQISDLQSNQDSSSSGGVTPGQNRSLGDDLRDALGGN